MTLEELSKLDDAELNRLAAEKVMGWVFREEVCQDHPYQGETLRNWIDRGGKCQSAAADWSPALDRVQSGWLLTAMVGQGQGAEFEVCFRNWQRVVAFLPDGKVRAVPGISPRSETIAALLVAFAMEGKGDA